jgi:hypothetical protein
MPLRKKKLAPTTCLLALLLISGCGTSADNSSESSAETKNEIGTGGQLIPIQSNNVAAAGYNESTQVMTVQFRNGALYEYYGVPSDLWESFIAAQPDPWSQIGYPQLVQAGVPYKRIG